MVSTSSFDLCRTMKPFIMFYRTLLFFSSFLALSSLHAQTTTDWINGALDTNNLVFDNFGTGFSLDDETGSVGGTSVVSNPTNHGRSAGFSFEIEGPLSGSFRWKVSSERAYDELVFRVDGQQKACLLYTSPSPRDKRQSRMPSSA